MSDYVNILNQIKQVTVESSQNTKKLPKGLKNDHTYISETVIAIQYCNSCGGKIQLTGECNCSD